MTTCLTSTLRGVVKELRDAVIATETPIMVLGHGTEPRHRARFLWAGATAYHCKPLNVAEVNRSVATLLDVAILR
jgi:DNA-binding response OmpR family regulator